MNRLLCLLLLMLTGCLSRLNENMERSNELMEHSIVAVQANTVEIQKSTQLMYLAPFFGIIFLAVLFTPLFRLFRQLKAQKKK